MLHVEDKEHFNKPSEDLQMLQVELEPELDPTEEPYFSEFTFLSDTQSKRRYDVIPETWILLDSKSTVLVIRTDIL